MRQKFDAGEDPLDPENQQGGGREQAWPFHFDPFQSGGSFHFKFQYNWERARACPVTDTGEVENTPPAFSHRPSLGAGLADYLNVPWSEKWQKKNKDLCAGSDWRVSLR